MRFHIEGYDTNADRGWWKRAALLGGAFLATFILALPASAVPPDKPEAADAGNYYTTEELSEIYELYIDAFLAHEARDATRELEILRKLENRRPRSGHIHAKIARVLLKEGETEEALEMARKAVDLAPENYEVRQTLGQAFFQAGELDSASAEFEKALEIRPNDYASLLYLSEIYETAGDYIAAATSHMRLGYLRPNNAWQHQYRAAVNLIRAGEYEQATAMLERVVETNPAHHEALSRLARLYRALGRNEDAARLYRQIIERFRFRDAVADAHVQLAEIYYEMGRVEDAEEELLWVLKNRPGILEARRKLGIIRYSKSDYDSAIDLLSDWVERHPERLSDVYYLARAYQSRAEELRAKGETAKAVEDASAAAKWYGVILDSDAGHLRSLEGLRSVLPPEKIGRVIERYDEAIADLAEATGEEEKTKNLLRRALLASAKAETAEGSENPEISALADAAWDQSIELYEEILETEPDNAAALEALGGIYQERQEWQKARDYYLRLHELEPEDTLVLYRLGFTEFHLRDFASARDRFEEGVKQASSDVLRAAHYYYLGVTEYLLGDYEGSEAALRAGMDLSERKEDYISQLSMVLLRRGKYEEAEDMLWEALEENPNQPEYVLRLAIILQERDKTEEAVDLLEKALEASPDNLEYIMRLAMAYDAQGARGKAENLLENAIKRYPEQEDLYLQLALIYERRKDLEGIERTIRRLLEVNENSADAFNFLGYTYADYNVKLDEAEELIAKALEQDPENPMYIDSLGWVYYRQGKFQEAVRELRRAVEKIGTDATVLDHLGDALYAVGKTNEALEYWRKALDLEPDQEEIREKIDGAKQAKQ
jgi:tetratricopeptide (TPR) repeat protein